MKKLSLIVIAVVMIAIIIPVTARAAEGFLSTPHTNKVGFQWSYQPKGFGDELQKINKVIPGTALVSRSIGVEITIFEVFVIKEGEISAYVFGGHKNDLDEIGVLENFAQEMGIKFFVATTEDEGDEKFHFLKWASANMTKKNIIKLTEESWEVELHLFFPASKPKKHTPTKTTSGG